MTNDDGHNSVVPGFSRALATLLVLAGGLAREPRTEALVVTWGKPWAPGSGSGIFHRTGRDCN